MLKLKFLNARKRKNFLIRTTRNKEYYFIKAAQMNGTHFAASVPEAT